MDIPEIRIYFSNVSFMNPILLKLDTLTVLSWEWNHKLFQFIYFWSCEFYTFSRVGAVVEFFIFFIHFFQVLSTSCNVLSPIRSRFGILTSFLFYLSINSDHCSVGEINSYIIPSKDFTSNQLQNNKTCLILSYKLLKEYLGHFSCKMA